ncbi:alpha/beta fold hydrolase [Paracandidimonas lactea]|uniref:alpha/beta fold hydrolase n=1 Tax=Paracandidimonas lactea TaxID=2895524 RepID=UPI001EF067C7|nr:alpha/beta hydrolase [Paracandidimonas lactea]
MTVPARLDLAAQPRLDYVVCASPAGLHRMAYWEWGDPGNDRVLLCVHGLTRTGRDFDYLARRMAAHYRVVCPDIVGRGRSDWLVNPAYYVVPQYVADVLALIARLRPVQLDWVGTSMGGLIGMAMAGGMALACALRPERPGEGLSGDLMLPVGRYVLNDIGPTLDLAGLARIAAYVGQPRVFGSFDEAVDYVRSVSEGFGLHDRAGWEDLTRHVFLPQGGRWVQHYDLRIAEPFALQNPASLEASEVMLWQAYESIQQPVLIMRGEKSDLLTEQTAQEMLRRNPNAQLHTVAGVGHAPTLRDTAQIAPIEAFLLA